MSKQYTKAVASFITKRMSRKKVAQSMKASIASNAIIHYLGGTSTQTPFENQFKKGNTFVRYERMKAIVPNGYNQVTFDQNDEPILQKKGEKGYFVNDDFFNSYWDVSAKLNDDYSKEEHFWLDFCGMPKSDLLEKIYYTFLYCNEEIENWNFKSLYLTFFLNPRSCEDVKKNLFVNGEKNTEEKANTLLNKFKEMVKGKEIDCEIFETYMNGVSPMCVIKIERRTNDNDMAKTASVDNYVNLHKRGFSNKQIAIFWKAGIMQVAGFAATAKRKKLI